MNQFSVVILIGVWVRRGGPLYSSLSLVQALSQSPVSPVCESFGCYSCDLELLSYFNSKQLILNLIWVQICILLRKEPKEVFISIWLSHICSPSSQFLYFPNLKKYVL